jgi:hypothetical protein
MKRSPISALYRVGLVLFALIALPIFLYQGCSKSSSFKGKPEKEGAGIGHKEYEPEYAETEYGLGDSGGAETSPLSEMAPLKKSVSSGDTISVLYPGGPSDTEGMPGERKRVYSGYCRLRVNSAEDRKAEIFSLAEESGGYVESAISGTIVIRVPAGKFDAIFETILGLGDVDSKSIETYDVTEYFRDVSVRLEIAERTRARLYRLLEKTEDVDERLELLKEIRRLTDEIERIKQNLEMIKKQISFSRITVELISLISGQTEDRNKIPFGWIRELDPLYVSLPNLRGRVDFELEDGFAVFVKDNSFRAESPEGTRVRVGTTRNEPRGDTAFWQEAVAFHLSGFYREYQKLELGSVRAVLFTSKDTKPFYYLTGVSTAGDGAPENKTLYVIEIFFPDSNALELRLDGIKKSIEGFSAR